MMKTRFPIRTLAGMFGVLLLVLLIRRAGIANLRESIAAVGWRLVLVIALGGVAHVVKTWAWRLTLLDDKREVSFARTLGLRLASEAVGQLGFLGQMFGENLRVLFLSSTIPLANGIASVTLDRAFFILSGAVVSIVGLVAVLVAWPLPHALSLYAGLLVAILLSLILSAAVAVRRRHRVVSGAARLLGRIPFLRNWIERQSPLIEDVEHCLLNFYHRTPGAFWGSVALNLATHAAAILEVYLILFLLGAKFSFLAAVAIEALTKLINIVGLFNPGNIGTYEGGNMLVAKMFGLTAATGLTLGLARRVRALFWAAVGGLCMVVLSKSKSGASSPQPETPSVVDGSHVAVILASTLAGGSLGSTLPRVGALPVLLRAILGAQRAGARRIAVVVDREARSSILRALQSTRRLPASVEWFELDVETSLTSVLGQIIGAGESTVVLISGDTTYHPSLHRRAAEWNANGGALALRTGTQLVGIYALSQAVAQDLAHGQASVHSLEELDAYLSSRHSVEERSGRRRQMATGFYFARARNRRTETRLLARQAHRWNLRQNEPQSLHSHQPPAHQVSDHTQYGQSVHSRCQLYGRRVFCIGRLLECLARCSTVGLCKHSRRKRRRSRSLETSGIRFRLLVGDRLRSTLLSDDLRWNDDRFDEKLWHADLSGLGRAASRRSGPKLPRHQSATASADQWAS